jgi:nucleoside-diphosphate-sugar epimerase
VSGPGGAPLAVVTGASGFVGSHVVDDLVDRGLRVRAVLRERSSRQWLEGKAIEVANASLFDLDQLRTAVNGADWIVHAAGLIRARNAAEFHECNVGGTENVLQAALEARPAPSRFLFVSSQAASGPSVDGRPVEERDPPRPVSAYGASKLEAERIVLAAADRLPVTVIRPPAVYGPRDAAIFKVFRAAALHVRPVLKRGGRFSLVHIDDLTSAIHGALARDQAVGEVFFASEPDATDYETMGVLIGRALGTWTVPFSIPAFALRAIALGAEAVGGMTGRPPILTREKLREITAGDWICSSAKIRQRLGWAPRVPLEEGIRATADWYRRAGWL